MSKTELEAHKAEAQKQLAKIGIFGQPASAVPLASVKKLRKQNFLDENDTVVCIVTGGGLKDTTVLCIVLPLFLCD